MFRDDDLAYQPGGRGRSVGQLLAHLIDSYELTRHWLTHDRPPITRVEHTLAGSLSSAVDRLRLAQQMLFASIEALAPGAFGASIAPFGVLETRGVMALGMFKHELHHRGELHALARMCGHEPPPLYR